jgi:SsrA-binding protein
MANENRRGQLIAENRRARRDYELIERVEAGLVLTGSEVKSARDGHVQIGQAYADIRDGEAWLVGASISEYAQGGPLGHQSDRDRKLLLHRSEIDSLYGKVREKGLTLVPTRMYFKDGRIKVAISLAKGKKAHDKRETIKRRETDRETRAAVKERRQRA